jgi:hypothetical protein
MYSRISFAGISKGTPQYESAPDFVGNAARRTLHSGANIVVDNVNQLGHWIEGVGKDVWAARATLPCHTFSIINLLLLHNTTSLIPNNETLTYSTIYRSRISNKTSACYITNRLIH